MFGGSSITGVNGLTNGLVFLSDLVDAGGDDTNMGDSIENPFPSSANDSEVCRTRLFRRIEGFEFLPDKLPISRLKGTTAAVRGLPNLEKGSSISEPGEALLSKRGIDSRMILDETLLIWRTDIDFLSTFSGFTLLNPKQHPKSDAEDDFFDFGLLSFIKMPSNQIAFILVFLTCPSSSDTL
jgi:hypothetical protein